MIALGLEASILCASDAGEKPPKTTACMAPSRDMARMAKRAAGIMGTISCQKGPREGQWGHTVHKHNISLLHTLLPEHPSQRLYLREQLTVCVLLLAPRDRRVPNDGIDLAIAGLDVSVDAVVAGRYLAIRKPAEAGM